MICSMVICVSVHPLRVSDLLLLLCHLPIGDTRRESSRYLAIWDLTQLCGPNVLSAISVPLPEVVGTVGYETVEAQCDGE